MKPQNESPEPARPASSEGIGLAAIKPVDPKTIYVVTSGEYSDYSIDAMFSTRELADAWIALKRQEEYPSSFEIEEWALDANKDDRLLTVWSCGIMLESGEIIEGPSARTEVTAPFRGRVRQRAFRAPCYKGKPATRVESAVSVEHCLKLAAEERQAWLREGGNQ